MQIQIPSAVQSQQQTINASDKTSSLHVRRQSSQFISKTPSFQFNHRSSVINIFSKQLGQLLVKPNSRDNKEKNQDKDANQEEDSKSKKENQQLKQRAKATTQILKSFQNKLYQNNTNQEQNEQSTPILQKLKAQLGAKAKEIENLINQSESESSTSSYQNSFDQNQSEQREEDQIFETEQDNLPFQINAIQTESSVINTNQTFDALETQKRKRERKGSYNQSKGVQKQPLIFYNQTVKSCTEGKIQKNCGWNKLKAHFKQEIESQTNEINNIQFTLPEIKLNQKQNNNQQTQKQRSIQSGSNQTDLQQENKEKPQKDEIIKNLSNFRLSPLQKKIIKNSFRFEDSQRKSIKSLRNSTLIIPKFKKNKIKFSEIDTFFPAIENNSSPKITTTLEDQMQQQDTQNQVSRRTSENSGKLNLKRAKSDPIMRDKKNQNYNKNQNQYLPKELIDKFNFLHSKYFNAKPKTRNYQSKVMKNCTVIKKQESKKKTLNTITYNSTKIIPLFAKIQAESKQIPYVNREESPEQADNSFMTGFEQRLVDLYNQSKYLQNHLQFNPRSQKKKIVQKLENIQQQAFIQISPQGNIVIARHQDYFQQTIEAKVTK